MIQSLNDGKNVFMVAFVNTASAETQIGMKATFEEESLQSSAEIVFVKCICLGLFFNILWQ